MKFLEYPNVTSTDNLSGSADYLLLDGNDGTRRTLFGTFASWLLNKYNALSLGGSTRTAKSAIDTLYDRWEINTASSTVSIALGTATSSFTVRKMGHVVCIHSFSIGASGDPFSGASSGTDIGTLPSGYRPSSYSVNVPIMSRSTGAWATATYSIGNLAISTSGVMTIQMNETSLHGADYIWGGGITFLTSSVS